MFGHLLNVIARAISAIPNALASNWFGLVFFPILIVLINAVITSIRSGWKAVIEEWHKSTLVAGFAALLGLLAVFSWCLATVIYGDHVGLNSRIGVLRHLVDGDKTLKDRELQIAKDDSDRRFNDLQNSCSELRGAKGQLDKRVQDQEGTINNCQEHAIQLLTPEPQKITVLPLETKANGEEHEDDLLLITNRTVTPVNITGSCNIHLRSAFASPVGHGVFMGGTTLQEVSATRNSFRYGQVLTPNIIFIAMTSPAWSPTTPLRVHLTYTSYTQAPCVFTVR